MGGGDRPFRRELNRYLRQQLGAGIIKKFRFVDSKKDNLIQLADMIVGAMARSYNDNRKDSKCWAKMLENKLENVWDFCRGRTLYP